MRVKSVYRARTFYLRRSLKFPLLLTPANAKYTGAPCHIVMDDVSLVRAFLRAKAEAVHGWVHVTAWRGIGTSWNKDRAFALADVEK